MALISDLSRIFPGMTEIWTRMILSLRSILSDRYAAFCLPLFFQKIDTWKGDYWNPILCKKILQYFREISQNVCVSHLQQEVEAMIKAIEAEKQRLAQQWKVISEAKTKLSGKKQRLREDKKLIEDALRKMASIGENTIYVSHVNVYFALTIFYSL